MAIDVEKIRAALAKVNDPLFGKDVVTLGYVKELAADGEIARITLKLPTPAHPHKAELGNKVAEAARAAGAGGVKIDVTAEVGKRVVKPGGDGMSGGKTYN